MASSLMRIPLREVGGFIAVGILGLIADIGTFNLAVLLGVEPVAASLIGFVLGIAVSFIGNKILTFRHRAVARLGRALGIFVVINLVAVAFIQVVVWLGDAAGLDLIWLNVVRTAAIGLATIGRFFAYRRWVFMEPAAAAPIS